MDCKESEVNVKSNSVDPCCLNYSATRFTLKNIEMLKKK